MGGGTRLAGEAAHGGWIAGVGLGEQLDRHTSSQRAVFGAPHLCCATGGDQTQRPVTLRKRKPVSTSGVTVTGCAHWPGSLPVRFHCKHWLSVVVDAPRRIRARSVRALWVYSPADA